MKLNTENLIGEKFGRLRIIRVEKIEPRINGKTGKQSGYVYYLNCSCDCGNNDVIVKYTDLTRGHTVSCGCYRKEKTKERNKFLFSTANGETVGKYARLYRIYQGMIDRCYNENCNVYPRYGGRGIDISLEWLGKQGYQNFKEWSINNGYLNNLEIDRVNNDLGYSPENCRWATRKEQMNNFSQNNIIEYLGRKQTLSEWCDELNLNYARILARFNKLKMAPEEAFNCKKYEVIHKNIVNNKKVVLDGLVFNSIQECCEKYLHQTTGRFSKYLNHKEKIPDKWVKRGLRFFKEEKDSDLPKFNVEE